MGNIKTLALTVLLWGSVVGMSVGQSGNSLQISLGVDHQRLIDQGFTASKLKFTGVLQKII